MWVYKKSIILEVKTSQSLNIALFGFHTQYSLLLAIFNKMNIVFSLKTFSLSSMPNKETQQFAKFFLKDLKIKTQNYQSEKSDIPKLNSSSSS